jgi:UDP-2,3-diacylglucosamine pyrophosphatase LpxH
MRSNKERRPIRSLFVSDVHLGCRFAQTTAFLNYLSRFRPEYLYLVGDFIDGWKLSGRWFWDATCDSIIDRLFDLGRRGTIIRYTPGNHDSFLRQRDYLGEAFGQLDFLEIRDEFIHVTADSRRFLVVHGDQFDYVERRARWLSKLSSLIYDPLLALNRLWSWNIRRRRRHSPYGGCTLLKDVVKRLMKFISVYETKLLAQARRRDCDGVICGHVHSPIIAQQDSVSYCNTGDWVETCTAIVEHYDGRLELQQYYPMIDNPALAHAPPHEAEALGVDRRSAAIPTIPWREKASC